MIDDPEQTLFAPAERLAGIETMRQLRSPEAKRYCKEYDGQCYLKEGRSIGGDHNVIWIYFASTKQRLQEIGWAECYETPHGVLDQYLCKMADHERRQNIIKSLKG